MTLGLTGGIWVCTARQDGRKSFDGLQAVVTSHLGKDPLSGDLYVFRNKRGDRLKIEPESARALYDTDDPSVILPGPGALLAGPTFEAWLSRT